MEISLISLFLMALAMSFSHCVGMCGGIVIAYSSAKIHKDTSRFYQVFSHILYSLGRVSSYVVIGVVSAFVGHKISASMQTKGILFIVVGAFLILFAIFYAFYPKMISYIEPSLPKNPKNIISQSFKRFFVYFMKSQNLGSFYGLGILNGFLPCGMVYFFAGYALTASSAFAGGMMMVIFGAATILPMFAIGFFTAKINTSSFRNIFIKISFVLMVGFGVVSIHKGVLTLEGKSHSMGHMQHMQMQMQNMQMNTPQSSNQNPNQSPNSHHMENTHPESAEPINTPPMDMQ